MDENEFTQRLGSFCQRLYNAGNNITNLKRLSGGASMESWAFDYGKEEFVLRRLPSGIDTDDNGFGGIPLALQAQIINAAYEAGVTAPRVRAVLSDDDELGEGFIMDRAKGETLPHKILSNTEFAHATRKLTEQCVAELWNVHNIPLEHLPAGIDAFSPKELLEIQRQKYIEIGGKIPIFDFAFRWLEQNAPENEASGLVHGDFRMGNLMVGHDGITAVLDWELSRQGDPVQDLAYFCTPSWRFGNYEKEAGGFDTSENFLAAYAKLSGQPVDSERFRFWLVYSTLWWGIVCLVMGNIWRSGSDPSLERTVIGRRVSEVEIDLALLFSEIIPDLFGSHLNWTAPTIESHSGEITYDELLSALREWNTGSVLPNTKGHDLFQSRVAGNALGIAKRHAQLGQYFKSDADNRFEEIGLNNEGICDLLTNGSFEVSSLTKNKLEYEVPSGLWDHLRISALERCTIDQPKYAGLKAALEKWNQP